MACAKALAVGEPSYRTIKGILAAGLETDPPPPSTGDGGAAAFLHGPSRLFMNVVALPATAPATAEDTAAPTDLPVVTNTTTDADEDGDRDDTPPRADDRARNPRCPRDRRRRSRTGPAHPEAVRNAPNPRSAPHPGPRRGTGNVDFLSLLRHDEIARRETMAMIPGKSMILTSNRSPVDWHLLFPNPVVTESLLDRLINTSHQVFMNGPSYRPTKRPGRPDAPPNEATG